MSIIAIYLPCTITHDVQAAVNIKLSNSLVTEENLINIVELSEKEGINWLRSQRLEVDCISP